VPAWEDVLGRMKESGQRVVDDGLTVGMVLGIVRGGERHVLTFGETELGSGKAPDAESIYEIGSVSKVFTGILLADAVARDLVSLEDEVEGLIGEDFKMRQFEDEPIQLWHLSTHTSGLPRMPANFRPANAADPYADYTIEQMYSALKRYRLRRAPGEKYAYSNLGVGLLGNLLVQANETEGGYGELLQSRISRPLGLEHTATVLTPWMKEHLVPGYDVDRNPAANWTLTSFAGAGGIRSNVNDMLTFAEACLHPDESQLAEALNLSMEIRYRDENGTSLGLGWHAASNGKTRWHNEQTGGYHTFFAIWPAGDVGVIMLSNSSSGLLDRWADSAVLLMMGREPHKLAYKKPIPVDPVECEQLVGEYKMGVMSKLTVSLRDGRMYAQMSFQSELRIYPLAPDQFFYRAVEAELIFQRDETGAVVGVHIEQGGTTTKGKRL
jgi:serine-type D-Ala-D-Ala carboxypeptidase/endopeptidase